LIDFADGRRHLVYTGRGGFDMADALTVLFRAFRRYRASHPADAGCWRFHFIGTGYAPPPLGEDTVLPIARVEGVADAVSEHRYRVPYFDALHYLCRADAVVAVGSSDPGYSASKIFPYALAGRPLLLIYQEQSPVLRLAAELGVGLRIGFSGAASLNAAATAVHSAWFVSGGCDTPLHLDAAAFAPHSAVAMTAALASVLDVASADRAK
jgi:hypothetical protein